MPGMACRLWASSWASGCGRLGEASHAVRGLSGRGDQGRGRSSRQASPRSKQWPASDEEQDIHFSCCFAPFHCCSISLSIKLGIAHRVNSTAELSQVCFYTQKAIVQLVPPSGAVRRRGCAARRGHTREVHVRCQAGDRRRVRVVEDKCAAEASGKPSQLPPCSPRSRASRRRRWRRVRHQFAQTNQPNPRNSSLL